VWFDLVWRAVRNAKPKICVYYADRTPKYAFTTLRRCPPE
jgi:hypothetical protein